MFGRHYANYYFPLIIIALHSLLVDSAKILGIFPYPNIAQSMLVKPFVKALAKRGHEFTVVHGYPVDSDDDIRHQKNVRLIYVKDSYNVPLDFYDGDYSLLSNKWREVNYMLQYCVKISLNVLENREVKMLLNSNASFDLIVMEPGQTDALYGIGRHFDAPLLGISTCGSDWNIDHLVGYTASSIYEPILPVGYKRGLTLFERFYNLAFITEEWLFMNWVFVPGVQKVHKQYFPRIKDTVTELRSNFSLILLNQHFTLSPPRPNVPSLIEVGGLHIPDKLQALPYELESFIDGAPNGVIYFSMGSEIIASRLPKTILDALLETFRRLKQRVIIKLESSGLQNTTDQLYISDWLPQMSILAHPNVKLFITHGGMLCILEAANFATPIIGLPQYYDQFENVRRMTDLGVGLSINLNTLTVSKLQNAIEQILYTESYAQNAVVLSQRFRDQPVRPLDNAIYWTEYVIRYRGASHMKVATTHLKLMDYYYVDRILLIICRLSLTTLVLLMLCWMLKRCLNIQYNTNTTNL